MTKDDKEKEMILFRAGYKEITPREYYNIFNKNHGIGVHSQTYQCGRRKYYKEP